MIFDALRFFCFFFLLHFSSHSIQDQSLGGFAYGKYGRLAEGGNPTALFVLSVMISLVDILTANQAVILYSLSPIHLIAVTLALHLTSKASQATLALATGAGRSRRPLLAVEDP